MKNGLLLVGHGTRNARGLNEFWTVARQVAELADEFVVEPSFLELAEPAIPAAVERLLQQGVERLTVAPILLFAAGHAKRDIPAAVAEAVRGHDDKAATGGRAAAENVAVNYLGALECHPKILELSAQRFAEAVRDKPHVDAAETLLLLVGRGSSHADAIAAMRKFAALRNPYSDVDRVETCFVAVAQPTLEEGLSLAAHSGYRRIVVQPHLLFTGEVLEQIAEEVARVQEAGNNVQTYKAATVGRAGAELERASSMGGPRDQEWIIAHPLGPSPLVAEAMVEIVRSARHL
ncbi:MAG TPA: sirohydrochlorin chelatase [Pirellulales bacterium]|nr:sirohydrochlorin chelatase [Pirellulales bacterium]